ncbi:MAG: neutral/alkaline non-lysosomal ceramidase N-terminal domain-containing protein [Bacteroidota bacterium]
MNEFNYRRYYIRQFFIRLFRVTLIFSILLLLVALILFWFVDRPAINQTAAYQRTMAALDTFEVANKVPSAGTIKIGWSKASITPDQPTALAGYGARKANVYQSVHDSVFVRSFVFENQQGKSAIVSADLLIFPPKVLELIQDELPQGLSLSNIYFTATHTHSSIGGWQPGFVGKLFAGTYDEAIVRMIAEAVITSLQKANADTQYAKIGYRKIDQKRLIRNRLVKERGTVDPWLRLISIKRVTGESALLFTYAAHPTCLSYHYADLSGDYPAKVIKQLQDDYEVDFAAYMAGAVGSMSPEAPGLKGYEKINFVAGQLADVITLALPTIETAPVNTMNIHDFPFDPGDPQFKVTENIRLREWAFNQAFGRHEMEITSMQLGDLLLVGLPCDFSGELVAPLELYASQYGFNLVVTSFNGGYAGYVTKDKWYDLEKYETRTMNWYSHQMGAYLSESVKKVIDGYAKNR